MNQLDILELISAYAATGHIDDRLIPYYDQTGRWRGDIIPWRIAVPEDDLCRIRDSHLEESRRVFVSNDGPVLRTSLVRTNSTPLSVVYIEIEGNLIVTKHVSIHAPLLRRVSSDVVAFTNRRIHMPRLNTVGGRLKAMNSRLLHVPSLREVGGDVRIAGSIPPILERVGGRMAVYEINNFEMPLLRLVGGSLITKAESVNIPLLEKVGGNFVVNAAKKINVSSLVTVVGDFLAPCATAIYARCLRNIAGDMNTRSAKGFYHPSIKVGHDWTCYLGAVEAWVAAEKAKEILRARLKDVYL